ncbi:hypothetical protein KDC22_23750 [Paenibacillus tritici]|uniref:DUF6550 family protein n=1 Tax=Paenibacillus tritici TaxID=1873425 RepID=UPI001BAC1853|nr:DUF6550 family protein [Paenibacillus tritici]QUL53390.1 hypothetical protein KDC22_23750 [Paenibacillus tritici]
MKRKIWAFAGGIVIVGFIVTWAAWPHQDSSQIPNPANTITAAIPSKINVPEIEPSPTTSPQNPSPSPSPISVAEIIPQPTISETPVLQLEKEKKNVEVPIAQPAKTQKPTQPPKPKVKASTKPQSPASTPAYEEKTTQPNKQKDEPKAGEKNNDGKVYVPGFGWVEDQGGGTQVVETGNDGDLNKQVGDMD